jgi:integrase
VGLGIEVHPPLLRYTCGYYLANQGLDTRLIQDWLRHRNSQHTVRYTRLNPEWFHEINWNKNVLLACQN